jgi:hypothetical protein
MDGFARIEVSGKGAFVGKYALDVGAKLEFLEYQVGWTGMVEGADGPQTTLDLALLARDMIEADNSTAADPIYRKLLDITSLTVKPWDSVTRVARGEACVFFARMALAHGHVGAAMDWFNEALRVDPKAVEYRIELATRVYLRMEMLDLAVREATRATEIEPMNPRAWRALGSLEHENNHAQAAIAAYDMALKVAPGDPEATLDRTTVAMDVEDYGLVKRLCEQLRFTKHWPDALHILGMAAYREDRHEAAVELFEQAIAAGCRDVPTVRWHQSHALESIGRYREANKARAHRANSRLRPTLAMPFQRFNLPLWEGQPGPATIHVHSESGAGDNICLVRYLPMLTARGYKVHYEGHEGMLELVARSMPEVDVMPRATNFPGALGLKSFDYHLPIGEIQNAFDTDIDTVPWNGPYLHPGEEAVERYRDELPNGKKIGLCWSSGIRTNATWLEKYGLRKSMHFDVLRTVIKRVMGDLTYVSLQVGPERIQHGGALIDVLPEYPDWDDTAALIANLDLVITVDTAVAHMAGAMGKPTWLMMHPGGSWHWMVERPGAPWNEASPWYPSVRIFRQDKPGDWGGVISRVAEALRHVGT